jgi:SAM domain (Sterile alpha motif)
MRSGALSEDGISEEQGGTFMDIPAWLLGLGLEQYESLFRANHIHGDLLRSLTAEDLRELGISSVGHRRRLLDAINALQPAADMPTPVAANATEDRALIKRAQCLFEDMNATGWIEEARAAALSQNGKGGTLPTAKTSPNASVAGESSGQ